MKKTSTIYAFFLLLSCKSQELTYPLIYTPAETIMENILYNRSLGVLDERLSLYEDKTYLYETCTLYNKGTWERRGDSLFLKCESKGFHTDSLNSVEKYKYLTVCSDTPSVWMVKKRGIQRSSTLRNGNKKKKHNSFLIYRN